MKLNVTVHTTPAAGDAEWRAAALHCCTTLQAIIEPFLIDASDAAEDDKKVRFYYSTE